MAEPKVVMKVEMMAVMKVAWMVVSMVA